MRVRALAPVVVALVAGGLPMAVAGADVHATIGTNAVPMPEHSTTYRLELDGTATRIATRPVSPTSTTSPDGRYRVQFGTSGAVLIDGRSGARRSLAIHRPEAAVYWGPKGLLALTDPASGVDQLVVFDPATGARRVAATRVCGVSANPWSPTGDRLAVAVSLRHHGCDGKRLIVVAVADARHGPMRRITQPWTDPVSWTRDGHSLLIEKHDRTGSGVSLLVDPRTGLGRVVLGSYNGFLGAGAWSDGRRFFAISAIDSLRRGTLLVLDGTLRRRVGTFTFGQAQSWAPHRQWLAVVSGTSIRVFDASARRVIATIPVRAPFGLGIESLSWTPDERSMTLIAAPGLGHD
jgi:hypothetical protein